ncbi:hypothetical protein SAMN05216525_11151 [Bradyrhizobium sp. Gha]|nr:hypothetical protein SAMN05216525_11151 [Bradyrhizobium sp. Gha]
MAEATEAEAKGMEAEATESGTAMAGADKSIIT